MSLETSSAAQTALRDLRLQFHGLGAAAAPLCAALARMHYTRLELVGQFGRDIDADGLQRFAQHGLPQLHRQAIVRLPASAVPEGSAPQLGAGLGSLSVLCVLELVDAGGLGRGLVDVVAGLVPRAHTLVLRDARIDAKQAERLGPHLAVLTNLQWLHVKERYSFDRDSQGVAALRPHLACLPAARLVCGGVSDTVAAPPWPASHAAF